MESKTCSTCRNSLPLEEFISRHSSITTVAICSSCCGHIAGSRTLKCSSSAAQLLSESPHTASGTPAEWLQTSVTSILLTSKPSEIPSDSGSVEPSSSQESDSASRELEFHLPPPLQQHSPTRSSLSCQQAPFQPLKPPDFRYHGVHMSDPPSLAAACKKQSVIQRSHQAAQHHDEIPSATPTLSFLHRAQKQLQNANETAECFSSTAAPPLPLSDDFTFQVSLQTQFYHSANNNLNSDQVPDLPFISQVEEMLIVRVHVFVEIRQVRGQQYKYKGHVVNFLRDTGHIYNSLPLLLKDLDIIVLRPSNTSADPRLSHQFRRDFIVQKAVVKQWLAFLRVNHPGYANIDINQEALEALPVNEDVTDQLMIEDIEDAQLNKEINSDDIDNSSECAAVPDLLAHNEEVEQLRQEFEQTQNSESDLQLQPQLQQPQILQHELTMPSFCNTSFDEFNNTYSLLS
ncbi:hypothetical protein I7I51_02833 [Histoplasma capsulatum]|uniref:DUF6570 domain-containing protein n=1 Tax=Ajellomyces capsulatus TaxID=5037 RepID=A0A8A1MPH8_AJECA|nr:hypothetical protein I7I51_02833 [Histoplasma capsulatum]